jgi:hypothetical protein
VTNAAPLLLPLLVEFAPRYQLNGAEPLVVAVLGVKSMSLTIRLSETSVTPDTTGKSVPPTPENVFVIVAFEPATVVFTEQVDPPRPRSEKDVVKVCVVPAVSKRFMLPGELYCRITEKELFPVSAKVGVTLIPRLKMPLNVLLPEIVNVLAAVFII